MGILFRGTGTLASIATILLVTLDIMQKHLGIDTQALLAGFGGGFGDVIAGFSASFGDLITFFANMLSDATSGNEPAAAIAERGGEALSATKSLAKEAKSFEYAVQTAIGLLALVVGFFAIRSRG